jgi:hypothetical protein
MLYYRSVNNFKKKLNDFKLLSYRIVLHLQNHLDEF